MTFMQALIALAIAGLIAGGVVLLLRKKTLPLPLVPFLKARTPEMVREEDAALRELAQKAVSRYPELGSTPNELLTEINGYCNKTHAWSDSSSRIILEKLLRAGSLQQAMSYWQVHKFLDYRDKARKTGRA
jgi:hypothetical protein